MKNCNCKKNKKISPLIKKIIKKQNKNSEIIKKFPVKK